MCSGESNCICGGVCLLDDGLCCKQEEMSGSRRAKGRTGWPQHVWALELKQEHPNGM